MSQSLSTPQLVGVSAAGPYSSRYFAEVRVDALARWHRQRADATGEAWECRWQNASRTLAHTCSTPNCTETHVSLYCSFNDAADQLVDLLTDERLDHLLIGTAPDLSILPWSDSLDPDTSALFRFYVRVLWATEVILDDLEQLLKHTAGKKDLRSALSKGAPLDVNTLRAFINHVGKHGASSDAGLHCWNHHAGFFFEDANPTATHLAGLTILTAHQTPAKNVIFDAVAMPKLDAIVDTITTALRNLDAEINTPAVLAKLALSYGTCWSR